MKRLSLQIMHIDKGEEFQVSDIGQFFKNKKETYVEERHTCTCTKMHTKYQIEKTRKENPHNIS